MILHPNSNKPCIKILEMSGLCERCQDEQMACPRCQGTGFAKCAEIDITNMTSDQVWDAIKTQEKQGRTWEYKTVKPYNWSSFDEGKEVER